MPQGKSLALTSGRTPPGMAGTRAPKPGNLTGALRAALAHTRVVVGEHPWRATGVTTCVEQGIPQLVDGWKEQPWSDATTPDPASK